MDGGAWRAAVHGVARVGHDWSDLAAAAAAAANVIGVGGALVEHIFFFKFFSLFWGIAD